MKWIVITKLIAIFGLPGRGKTALANVIQSEYANVISNVAFKYHWKIRCQLYNDIENLINYLNEKPKWQKALIVFDEAWINANARLSMSKNNRIVNEIVALQRKYECDMVFCSQLDRQADIILCEMADVTIDMNRFREDGKMLFVADAKKNGKNRSGHYISNTVIDLIWFQEISWFTYDSMEKSKIQV